MLRLNDYELQVSITACWIYDTPFLHGSYCNITARFWPCCPSKATTTGSPKFRFPEIDYNADGAISLICLARNGRKLDIFQEHLSFLKALSILTSEPKSLLICVKFRSTLPMIWLSLSHFNYQDGVPQIPGISKQCYDIHQLRSNAGVLQLKDLSRFGIHVSSHASDGFQATRVYLAISPDLILYVSQHNFGKDYSP